MLVALNFCWLMSLSPASPDVAHYCALSQPGDWHGSQDPKYFHHREDPQCGSLRATPAPNLGNHESVTHFYNFVTSRMLLSNVIIENVTFWDWLFSPWSFIQVVLNCVSIVHFSSLPSSIPWCWCSTVCIIHPLKNILFPVSDYHKESCCKPLCVGICVNVNFHFCGINSQECSYWATW